MRRTRQTVKSSSTDLPSPSSDSGVSLESRCTTPGSSCDLNGSATLYSGQSLDSDENEELLEDSWKRHRGLENDKAFLKTNGGLRESRFVSRKHARRASRGGCGPDRVAVTDKLMTWEADQAVKLRTSAEGPLSVAPLSIMSAFEQTVLKYPDHPALVFKETGNSAWERLSYREYYDTVCLAAKAFIKLGLEPYHGVGIIGFNSVEWFIADLGCIFAGGLATGIYTTNSPDACRYVAHSARCNVIVVENDVQLQKILAVRDQLPCLKAIVQYRGHLSGQYANVYTWKSFLSIGSSVSDEVLEERIVNQAPNKCCTLIYTLVWTAQAAGLQGDLVMAGEILVSYLPLSHVAAQILDIFIPMTFAGTVYFAQPDALKGSLGDTLKDVRPTAFLGVPRVWEKMQEKMIAVAKNQWRFQIIIARWAKSIGLAGNLSRMNGGDVPYGWTLANFLVFRKVRNALGFDRCKFCLTAAAPIMKDTLDFFMSLNIPLMEIYGMSESTGPHTVSFPWRYRTVSVGEELFGSTTKFLNPDENGNGEVCMNGRNIFMGYINMEDKTCETLGNDGWLRSGDIGRRDESGYIFITGRIKELLITAGGENVSPILIEDAVKELMPCASNTMLIGDGRKYLSILLTLKTEVDRETSEPLDRLTSVARDWFVKNGLGDLQTVSQVIRQPINKRIVAAIDAVIDRVNEKAISRAQHIQKWTILPTDFSISGGELGPTLKLKRNFVLQKYHQTIESLYSETNGD